MNVFIVPSWYPSVTESLTGIFFKEQAMAMAQQYEDSNIGISTWGQNDERLLLWSRKPINSFRKLLSKPKEETKTLLRNLAEFFTPAYTWTKKVCDGNFDQILKANQINFDLFEKAYGKVDIIHAHVGYPGGYIAKTLSKKNGIPYVITEHMSPFPHRYFLTNTKQLMPSLAEAYKYSAKNICVSNHLKESVNSFGITNTCVIPNLVDEGFFIPKKDSLEKLEILSVGRLEDQKGFSYLIEAFGLIHQKHPNAKLKIIGEGSLRHQLVQKAGTLNLLDFISFVGLQTREQVRDAMQTCTLFVLASLHENLPLVLLEATSCGKPIVSTKCKGPEAIITKTNGRLAKPKNAYDLFIQIDHILSNIDVYDTKDIRKKFEKKYSKSVVCNQIYNTYMEAINSHLII